MAAVLLVSCSEKPPIPPETMSDIYYDIFLTDQIIDFFPESRMAADSLSVYEALLAGYGYSTEDFLAALDYYRGDSQLFYTLISGVTARLDAQLAAYAADAESEAEVDAEAEATGRDFEMVAEETSRPEEAGEPEEAGDADGLEAIGRETEEIRRTEPGSPGKIRRDSLRVPPPAEEVAEEKEEEEEVHEIREKEKGQEEPRKQKKASGATRRPNLKELRKKFDKK